MLELIKSYTKKRKDGRGNRGYGIYLCGCGSQFEAMKDNVRTGNTTKCKDCADKSRAKLRTTHGKTGKSKSQGGKLYYTWQAMKRRCNNPQDSHYRYYGALGIKVCERWENSFEAFASDMGEPEPDQSIERVDRKSGYCPNNCKWASVKEQANNRGNNRLITAFGKTMTLAAWCEDLDLKYHTVKRRIGKYRMEPERALSQGSLVRKSRYTADGEEFKSLSELASSKGMSISGVHGRIQSSNWPNWQKR